MQAASKAWVRLVAVLVLIACCTAGFAQSDVDGAVGGRVVDQRGDPVPGALVTVESAAQGVSRIASTGKDGEFLVVRLVPGPFKLTITAAGFGVFSQTVQVQLGSVALADARLAIAPALTQIDVEAAPVPLPGRPEPNQTDAASAEASNEVVTAEQAKLLPIDGRRWQSFALLRPEVNSSTSSDGLAAISFRGLAATQNSSEIDGGSSDQSFGAVAEGTGGGTGGEAETEDDAGAPTGAGGDGSRGQYGRHAGAAYTFAQEAVQEFRIHTGTYSALDGHAAGGVVTTISKSGTNAVRGSVFYLVRDAAWGAANPFSTVTRYNDGVVTNSLVKPPDLRQQFGGSVGGPVRLQGRLPLRGNKLFYFVTLDGQRRGFPAVSSPGYSGFFALTATQQALLANRGVSPEKTTAALNYLDSLTGTAQRREDQDIAFGKLDWQASAKNRISVQENRVRWSLPAGVRSEAVVERGIASIGNAYGKVDAAVARWVDLWTSHLSNEVRVAYGRDFEYETPQQPLAQEPDIAPGGLVPEVSIGPDGFIFGTPASLGRKAYPDEQRLQFAETVEWVHRRHLVQVGAEYSQIHDHIDALPNQEGTFNYDSDSTAGHAGGLVDWITDYTFSANAYPNGACPSIDAKIHLFCFRTFTQSFGQEMTNYTTGEWAGFVQDQWRVGARLRLSVGARYEYERLPRPQQPNAALDTIFGARGATSSFPEDRNNAGPRIGLAWQPFGQGKGTVRVGYGVYYGRVAGATIRSALADTALPISATHVRITPSTVTGCPQVANQGFGYGCDYLTTPPAAVSTTTSAVVFDRHFRLPMVQQGSFALERELRGGVTASASYVMNLDRQLPNSVDINIAPSNDLRVFQLQGGPVNGSGPNGVSNGETFIIPFYAERISTLYGPVTDVVSNANATYNALVLEAERRSRKGLEFRATWTWAKSIDYGQNISAAPRTDAQFDPFTLGYDKGLSTLNFSHKVTASGVWEPAITTRRHWLSVAANHWELAPLLVESSGRPYSYEIFGGARLTGGHTSINGSGGAVYLPTLGRNTLRLPDTLHLDLKVDRRVRLTERLHLRASAEVFNLPNHVNYSSITTRAYLQGTAANGVTPLVFQDAATIVTEGLNVQPFGTYTAASTSNSREREVQLGVKLEF
jgi:hypothetical protein